VVIHTAAAKLGWVAVRRGDDGAVRIAFAPSMAAALIGVFIARMPAEEHVIVRIGARAAAEALSAA